MSESSSNGVSTGNSTKRNSTSVVQIDNVFFIKTKWCEETETERKTERDLEGDDGGDNQTV